MFFHDAIGILFLILIGSFLLFVPLATASFVVWVADKVQLMIRASLRSTNLNERRAMGVSDTPAAF
jgi:hypothetical protein